MDKAHFEGDCPAPGSKILIKNTKGVAFPHEITIEDVDYSSNNSSFEIEEKGKMDELRQFLSNGGYFEEKEVVNCYDFQSFEDFFRNYQEDLVLRLDESKEEIPAREIFYGMLTIFDFFQKFQRLPSQEFEDDETQILNLFSKYSEQQKSPEKTLHFLKSLVKYSKTPFFPLQHSFASVITEECFKFLGINFPIKQLLFHQSFEFLNASSDLPKIVKMNSRYSHMISLLSEKSCEDFKKERFRIFLNHLELIIL